MANIKSQIKRIRQDERRRFRNKGIRSYVKTCLRRAVEALESKDAEVSKAAVETAIKALDRAVSKGVLHQNNAANKKSRLMRHLNELGAAAS